MKAVTFTVKLTESNIELLQEFKENKQLGLLIRTYFDALACDRGGTLANLIGLSGGDVVRNSITATGVVANHYKSYLEAGLKDKIDFKDYLADVEKFQALPHEGYYGRGLTEKAVRGILENFISEINLNIDSKPVVDKLDDVVLEDMVYRLLDTKLRDLGLLKGIEDNLESTSEVVKPIINEDNEEKGIISPEVTEERSQGQEMALEEVEVNENPVISKIESVSDVSIESDDTGADDAADLLMNLGF